MALTTAEVSALKAFFATRRGRRDLRPILQALLVSYFEDRQSTVRELSTTRPPTATEVEAWKEEWKIAAEAAGADRWGLFEAHPGRAAPASRSTRRRARTVIGARGAHTDVWVSERVAR